MPFGIQIGQSLLFHHKELKTDCMFLIQELEKEPHSNGYLGTYPFSIYLPWTPTHAPRYNKQATHQLAHLASSATPEKLYSSFDDLPSVIIFIVKLDVAHLIQ